MKCNNSACDNDISSQALAKHKDQRFCSAECARSALSKQLKENGHYQRLSQAGNEAQHAYKERHGHVPGYENRAKALKDPNHHRRKIEPEM